MSECAIWSASTRYAPRATNIFPTTDLPAAMPPVRPTFSIPPPDEKLSPQRHRDTEKNQERKEKGFSVTLCLCGEFSLGQARDSSGTRWPRRILAAFTVL